MSESGAEEAARVVVGGVPMMLSYSLTPGDRSVGVGDEVTVELGRRRAKGWVVEKISLAEALSDLPGKKKKTSSQLGFFGQTSDTGGLKSINESAPAFLPEQLDLFRWMSEYYGVSLAEVIENALPRRAASKKVLCALPSSKLFATLEEDPTLFESLIRKAPTQAKLLAYLAECSTPTTLKELASISKNPLSSLRSLEEKGLVEIQTTAHLAVVSNSGGNSEGVFASERPSQLTEGQSSALKKIHGAIDAGTFSPFLLFGVTGSGKTEVYLQSIEKVLEKNQSALIVVPEISLTPQFLDQFKARLNVPIALLHSQVGAGARWDAWQSLLDGRVRVAIGARSAIFAPLQNLGLIVVDEEHEGSYKQSEGFRYQARDTAVMRAKFASCPILLGSATPSLESLVNVQKKRYRLLELPERASPRSVPTPELIDVRKIKKKDMPSENITPPLFKAIEETLAQKSQVVVMYNRRGFASYLQCETCSEVISCTDCSVPLTYHKSKHHLLCHYCGISKAPPPHCPSCRDPKTFRVEVDAKGAPLEKERVTDKIGALEHRGSGTEKVVDELRELFPEARIIRMDRDTVGTKGAYRRILSSMRSGEADILVGTQMIAKGHDLPGVTLVGVIDADVGLHLPDFRSSEKVYQLITQASGRAGRGTEAGRVLVQTREPEHPTLVATVTGRFKAFARYELEYRKKLFYPPVGRLLRLLVSSPDLGEANRGAEMVKDICRDALQTIANQSDKKVEVTLLGPALAPYERLRGRHRLHLLVKAPSARIISQLAGTLNAWKSNIKGFEDLRLSVDVDPGDLL